MRAQLVLRVGAFSVCSALAMLVSLGLWSARAQPSSASNSFEEKDTKKEAAKTEEEKQEVTGILVNKEGKPVKERKICLLMVTSQKQAIPFVAFTPEDTTDANGRFSMKRPKYILVPEGYRIVGFTVGTEERIQSESKTTAKPFRLKQSGEFAVIDPKSKEKTIDLGEVVLEE
jgi:hypothetical protein